MKDNAFTDVSNPDALKQAAREIDGKLIQERIDYWMNLFFKFDKGKYATRSKHLKHDWYLTQVEVCSNVIFKSARFCTSLFERLLDKFARVGLPDTIAKIFSLRPASTDSKTFWRLYDNNACIKHWFRGNAITHGEADLFDQPVLDHKDRKVTAPDLRKDRQMALCKELLKPKYSVYGFKTGSE